MGGTLQQDATIGLLAVVALLQLFRIVDARLAESKLSKKIGEVGNGESLASKLNTAAADFAVLEADFEQWRKGHEAEMRRRLDWLEKKVFGEAQGRSKQRD